MKTTIQSAAAGLLALSMCVSWQVSEVLAADTPRTLQPAQRVTRPLQTAPVSQPTPALVSVSKAEPNEASVSPGGSATVALSGTGLDGITSVKVGPDGVFYRAVTATLDDGSPSSRRLTISAGDAAVPGTYTVQIAVEGGGLVVLPAAVLSVVVSAHQPVTSAPAGMRTMGTSSVPRASTPSSTNTVPETSSPPSLSRRLEPGAASSDRLQDQTTAGLRSGSVADRMSRMQEGSDLRELPGGPGVTAPSLAENRGSLSSRLEGNQTATSQNPGLSGDPAGPLGEDLAMDRGMRDLAGQAEQFRGAAQSPGGMNALNPAKGTLPTQDGFTVDSRLAAGDETNDPAPAGTPKPKDPGPDSDGEGSGKKVVVIVISKKATKEEVQEAFNEAREDNPDAEIRAKKVDMTRYILGKIWSKFSSETKDEGDTQNVTIGVRGQCPPESMTCGLTGKTWAQLSPGKRKQFCDEFESELDKYRSGGTSGATACDAGNLKEPAWSEIMAGSLGPLILTDEEGDSDIIAPVTGSGWTKGDLVDTLPDPDDLGGRSGGGAVNPRTQ